MKGVKDMQVENINKQVAKWSLDVDGNNIRIENNANRMELFVNDKLQDVEPAAISIINVSARLNGKLPDGKEIKVVIGGVFKIHIYIFVDNELVLKV